MLNSLKRRVSKVIKKIDHSQNSFPIRQHNGFHCESCGTKNIIGDLFCCTICADYNLCSECFCSKLTSKNHELNHPCLIVTHPSRPPQSTRLDVLKETFKNKDFNISCDICDTKINGIYLKCNVCYCTFMCLECSKEHDKNHNLILYDTVRLEKFDIEDLKLQKMLDNGNFGFVYEAVLRPYGYHVACKLMNKKNFNKLSLRRLDFAQRDTNIVEKIHCVDKELEAYIEIFSPYIVKLLGYGRDQTQRLFLIMEFMEKGSLEDFMINAKKNSYEIPLYLKLRIMLNIASGIVDIHSKKFIHADLKPKNILLDSNQIAKICDLGSMKNANFSTYDNNTGGLYYLPLEFFMGKYDNKIDIYSFGLIMYHLFSGFRHAYTANNQLQLVRLSKIPLNFIKNLIVKATSMNPSERKTINFYKNILHAYFLMLNDVLNRFSMVDTQHLDWIILNLNDCLIEYINNLYDVKLDLNMNTIQSNQFLEEKVKKNLPKAINYLNEINTKNEGLKKKNIEQANTKDFF